MASWLFVAGAAVTLITVAGCTTSESGGSLLPADSTAAPSASSATSSLSEASVTRRQVSGDQPSTDSARRVNVPVPHGKEAVDALGVEIFVPAGLTLDPPCAGKSVNRPAYGLTYSIGCKGLEPPAVWIASGKNVIDGASPPRSTRHCLSRPVLDGEAGCVIQDPIQDATTIALAVIWSHHDVGIQIQAAKNQAAWAMRIFNSAHWVPVDRQGCSATRSPVGLPEAPTASGDVGIVPDDTASLSVCWYSQNRLVASAKVDSTTAIRSITHPTGVRDGPGIGLVPTHTPQASAPLCTDLDKTEGLVFLAHAPGRADAVSAAQLADCRGKQQWTDRTISLSTGEPLASALRASTGFLLVYGYSTAQQ